MPCCYINRILDTVLVQQTAMESSMYAMLVNWNEAKKKGNTTKKETGMQVNIKWNEKLSVGTWLYWWICTINCWFIENISERVAIEVMNRIHYQQTIPRVWSDELSLSVLYTPFVQSETPGMNINRRIFSTLWLNNVPWIMCTKDTT